MAHSRLLLAVFAVLVLVHSCASECRRNSRVYQAGDTYMDGPFKKLCKEHGGEEILACVGPNSGLEVPVNQERISGIWKVGCKKVGNSIQFKETAVNCNVNGEIRAEDDRWISGGYKYHCLPGGNGAYSIIACVASSGEEIDVNTSRTIGDYVHKCTKTGNRVQYSTDYVGNH